MEHGNVSAYIVKELLVLKQRIAAANISSSRIDESLNIATWNIQTDAITVATVVLVAIVAIFAFKFLRKGL